MPTNLAKLVGTLSGAGAFIRAASDGDFGDDNVHLDQELDSLTIFRNLNFLYGPGCIIDLTIFDQFADQWKELKRFDGNMVLNSFNNPNRKWRKYNARYNKNDFHSNLFNRELRNSEDIDDDSTLFNKIIYDTTSKTSYEYHKSNFDQICTLNQIIFKINWHLQELKNVKFTNSSIIIKVVERKRDELLTFTNCTFNNTDIKVDDPSGLDEIYKLTIGDENLPPNYISFHDVISRPSTANPPGPAFEFIKCDFSKVQLLEPLFFSQVSANLSGCKINGNRSTTGQFIFNTSRYFTDFRYKWNTRDVTVAQDVTRSTKVKVLQSDLNDPYRPIRKNFKIVSDRTRIIMIEDINGDELTLTEPVTFKKNDIISFTSERYDSSDTMISSEVIIKNYNFTDCEFTSIIFKDLDLSFANFENATFKQCEFNNCTVDLSINDATLIDVNFTMCTFIKEHGTLVLRSSTLGPGTWILGEGLINVNFNTVVTYVYPILPTFNYYELSLTHQLNVIPHGLLGMNIDNFSNSTFKDFEINLTSTNVITFNSMLFDNCSITGSSIELTDLEIVGTVEINNIIFNATEKVFIKHMRLQPYNDNGETKSKINNMIFLEESDTPLSEDPRSDNKILKIVNATLSDNTANIVLDRVLLDNCVIGSCNKCHITNSFISNSTITGSINNLSLKYKE